MSTLLSFKDYFRHIVIDINEQIESLISTQSLPLWVNPNNTKFYNVNGYKVGDIVIAVNDEALCLAYLEDYINDVANYIGMDLTTIKERNNWEFDETFYDIILYGGNILPHLRLQPLTVLSTSIRGFDIYMSTQGDVASGTWNYDMPGMSDAWLNLRTETSDAVDLTVDSIIEKLEEETDIVEKVYKDALSTHLAKYHFGAKPDDVTPTEVAINTKLDKLELIHGSRANATNDTIRMPLRQEGSSNIIGQVILISASTNEYIAAAIINIADVDINKTIVMPLKPYDELSVVVPAVLTFNNEPIETDADNVTLANLQTGFAVNSLYTMDDAHVIYKTTGIDSTPLTLYSAFGGFSNTNYNVVYTPIGKTSRSNNSEIQCMPIEEIKRTPTTLEFKINPNYVWQTSAINVCATGFRSNA